MSKISNAIHEIYDLNILASRDQWVNGIHPLVKLVITIGYILAVVSFQKYDRVGGDGHISNCRICIIRVIVLGKCKETSFGSAVNLFFGHPEPRF